MRTTFSLGTAFAVLSTCSLAAQAGNEVIFVGTSTSGSTDNSAFVASGTGAVLWSGPSSFTDNCTDAVWADTGRNLYIGQSLMNRVSRASWDGVAPTFSSFYTAPGACYGLGMDPFRKRLWVLTGSTGSNRELHCVDADIDSPLYGTQITQTNVLAGASRERWALSWSGNLAVVPHVFINSGLFQVVDTNPASPTFLQVIVSTPIPGAQAMGFSFVADCRVSLDDLFVYVLYTGLGAQALAVYDLSTSSWLDFVAGPGQQDLAIPQAVPNTMALAMDRSFAVLSCQGGGGFAVRVNFDYTTPANTTIVPYAGLTIPNANAISLSPENARACVTSTPQQVAPPGTLVIFDVQTGGVIHSVALPNMWNIYTTAWQDASPTATYEPFGAGCQGALGIPTLAAAPGSRPALGSTFTAVAGNLPFGIAVLDVGLSNTQTGSVPLPLPLGVIGMPGCSLLVDPLVSFVLVGPGTSATWAFVVPNQQSLFAVQFFSQAFSLDPSANAFGFAASNGTTATLGL
jgi:hypothetical protein